MSSHPQALVLGLALPLLGCQDYQVARIPHGDTFEQGGAIRPVDVLWILDNSATMTEEQDALAAAFPAFAEVVGDGVVDMQMGITTTDVEEQQGLLVGDVLTVDTEDLVSAFATQADVGTLGAREEQPLEALQLATSEPALSEGNDALFRDGTDLAIIIVTDEDDQSEAEVSDYLDHLADFASDRAYRVSVVGGPIPAGCASKTSSAEPAERLAYAVDLTDGVFMSICEQDYTPVLTNLAFGAIGLSASFELSLLPDLESVKVEVDDVVIHQRPEDGWQYDPADNAIVFDGLAVPRPGQEVFVEYYELYSVD